MCYGILNLVTYIYKLMNTHIILLWINKVDYECVGMDIKLIDKYIARN